jgi:hypothetical protein
VPLRRLRDRRSHRRANDDRRLVVNELAVDELIIGGLVFVLELLVWVDRDLRNERRVRWVGTVKPTSSPA